MATVSGALRRATAAGLLALASATSIGTALAAPAPPGVPAPPAPPGPPASLQDARTRAAALATEVRSLRGQVESAAEAYDAAASALAAAVGERVAAQTAAGTARQAAASSTDLAGARARALYESGGPLTLYAGLLSAGDAGGVAERLQVVQRVTASSRDAGVRAAATLRSAESSAAAVGVSTRAQSGLEQAAAAAALRVTALLATQERSLALAGDEVVRLAAQEEQRRQAAEQAAFAAQLADAYAAVGQPLLLGTAGGAAASPVAAAAASAMAALVAPHPPYLWGGNGPASFDCSGLTGAAFAAAGLRLPRTAAQQYLSGAHPALADLRPGDLLFWGASPAGIHHVAMYAGGGLMWSTNHSGDVARLQPIWGDEFVGATRPGG